MSQNIDPNKVLRELREAVKDYVRGHKETIDYRVDRIVENFEALDEWLSSDGELPKDWNDE